MISLGINRLVSNNCDSLCLLNHRQGQICKFKFQRKLNFFQRNLNVKKFISKRKKFGTELKRINVSFIQNKVQKAKAKLMSKAQPETPYNTTEEICLNQLSSINSSQINKDLELNSQILDLTPGLSLINRENLNSSNIIIKLEQEVCILDSLTKMN